MCMHASYCVAAMCHAASYAACFSAQPPCMYLVVVRREGYFLLCTHPCFLVGGHCLRHVAKEGEGEGEPQPGVGGPCGSEAKRARLEAEDSDDTESIDLERQLAV